MSNTENIKDFVITILNEDDYDDDEAVTKISEEMRGKIVLFHLSRETVREMMNNFIDGEFHMDMKSPVIIKFQTRGEIAPINAEIRIH